MLAFFKGLTKKKLRINGRNNKGIICIHHRGGGAKKRYRLIDFFFSFLNIPAVVLKIERDPNRSCFIALILFKNGFFSYIVCPVNLLVGNFILSSNFKILPSNGNSLPLFQIPLGSLIFNIELKSFKGACFCRSAGSFGIILNRFEKNSSLVLIRLKSKEEFFFEQQCFATIGIVSNLSFKFKLLKKAGNSRNLGIRPKVRGVAMNPIDHPHGGGEGKTSGGRPSVTPWGKLTKGKKTRLKKKVLKNKFIFKSRNF